MKRLPTGLSNGAYMLVHSTAAQTANMPAIRATQRPLLKAFRNVASENMKQGPGYEVMRRAGTTGAEVG